MQPVMNIKLTLEYDGSAFSGWQVQPEKMTVQGELQRAFSVILNRPIHVTGSGRTDAGVHALGQVANVQVPPTLYFDKVKLDKLKKGVNSIVRGPLVVLECRNIHESFHARYDALSKTYHYHILNRTDPCAVGRGYVWHIRKHLDVPSMQACCNLILGSHDFKSFEGTGSPRAHTVREILTASMIREDQDSLTFKVKGNGFLRFMVRNLMGTLVQAGHGKISPKEFKEILDAKDRSQAGATAPPQGLFLMEVTYPA